MAWYPFWRGSQILFALCLDNVYRLSFPLPRILLFSLPTSTSCLTPGQSAFIKIQVTGYRPCPTAHVEVQGWQWDVFLICFLLLSSADWSPVSAFSIASSLGVEDPTQLVVLAKEHSIHSVSAATFPPYSSIYIIIHYFSYTLLFLKNTLSCTFRTFYLLFCWVGVCVCSSVDNSYVVW